MSDFGVRHRDADLESGDTSPQSKWRLYPKYKNSGVKWLGEIPIAWNLTKLKRFVQFLGGGTPSKDNLEYWQGDIPWVSPKDMKSRIISDTIDKITEEAVAESATKVIGPGAVLIVVRSGILNHSIPVALSGTEVALNQDLKALIVDKSAVPEYLAYFILGMQSMLLFAWRKEGATVESLELELIANTVIPLPAIKQQRKIVGFLNRETAKIDALIENKERLIELLQEKRAALITQAVTKGLDPTLPMKDSGVEWLGEIASHWTITKLKYVAPLQGGYAFKSTDFKSAGISIVRMNNLKRGFIDLNDAVRIDENECLNAFSLKNGDLLLGMSGSLGETGSLGNYAIVRQNDLPCQLNQRVGRFIIANDLSRDFFLFFLSATPFTEPIIAESTGTAQFNISPENVGSLTMGLPKIKEQRNITAFLDRETTKIDALVAKIHIAIDRLKEYRTALISAAVTGKIDVRQEA